MIFDKPIIYTDTNFDAKPYDADWIDETPWTFSILPSLGLKLNDDNADKIKELIDRCIEDPSFTEGRAQARSDIWVNIGKSAELSADFIIRKYREVTGKSLKKKSGKKSRSKSKKKRRAGIKK